MQRILAITGKHEIYEAQGVIYYTIYATCIKLKSLCFIRLKMKVAKELTEPHVSKHAIA